MSLVRGIYKNVKHRTERSQFDRPLGNKAAFWVSLKCQQQTKSSISAVICAKFFDSTWLMMH